MGRPVTVIPAKAGTDFRMQGFHVTAPPRQARRQLNIKSLASQHGLLRLVPLAKGHVAWMQHASMVNHMACNYDENDRDSGAAYTEMVSHLLLGTLDKQPSCELYLAWLNHGDFSEKNLIMRAVAANQKDLIAQLKQAAAAKVDTRVFPTEKIMDTIALIMEKMPAAQERVAMLLGELSGPVIKHMLAVNAGKANGETMKMLKALSGSQYVQVTVSGSRGKFIEAIKKAILDMNPQLSANKNLYSNKLGHAVSQKIGDKPLTANLDIWISEDAVKGVPLKNLDSKAAADQLTKAISKPEDIEKLILNARADRVKAIGGRAGAIATVMGGILTAWNCDCPGTPSTQIR